MIRMLFAMVATLAVFLAVSLWWARDALLSPSTPADAEPPLAQLETTPSEPAPALPANSPADAPVSPAVPEPAVAADEIEEERVVTPAAFQPDEPPEGEFELEAEASALEPAPPVVSAHLDQDAWAHLIRRMLSLSRRTRAETR